MTTIAFLGLGHMGGPMAANLVNAEYTVRGFDPVPEARQSAADKGVVAVDRGTDAVKGADVVITMLPASADVEAVVLGPGGVLENAREGQLVMDMSTVDPQTSDKLAAELAKAGVGFVDAPVGRLASHAWAGESLFMVGASDADFARVKPLLEAMGSTIYHCGGPGTGTRHRVCCRHW